ncbi:MAG: RrF2 family transcriptional regulator [Paludibacteraceae bacterium]
MILNNTTEYALRILAFMLKEPEKIYTASCLVERLNISDKYLRRIMTDLSKVGFVKSIRGREGGYLFNRNAGEIYVSDVIDSIEGLGKHLACVLGLEYCSSLNPCALHDTFKDVRDELVRIAKTLPLSKLEISTIGRF